jgi:hypothetical protein|tara:strand:+ start:16 stop:546 length:531 start_codon:yes stop_codon:yes gene_type:complete
MKRIKTLLFLIFPIIVGCSSSTTSGINVYLSQGDNTNVWADIYTGTLTLHSSADVVGGGTGEDVLTESVTVEVTPDGYVHVTVQGTTINGIMDNSGAWAVLASIGELSSLISEKNINRLDDAGCSMSKKVIKIEGTATPHYLDTISGEVSGQMKCKRGLLTIVTLSTSGTLLAQVD